MDFGLSSEQAMLVETVRRFVEREPVSYTHLTLPTTPYV